MENLLIDLCNHGVKITLLSVSSSLPKGLYYLDFMLFLVETQAESQIYFWKQKSQYLQTLLSGNVPDVSLMGNFTQQARNQIKNICIHFEEFFVSLIYLLLFQIRFKIKDGVSSNLIIIKNVNNV